MKLIRIVFAVFIVLLISMAWFTSISSVSDTAKKYNEYIVIGDEAMEKSHYQEAYIAYEEALKINKNTDAQNKIITAYQERYNETEAYSDYDNLITAYDSAYAAFPDNTMYYETAMSLKLADNQYDNALSTYNKAKELGISSDEMTKMYAEIKYSYKIKNKGYEECRESVNGYFIKNIAGNWGWDSDDLKSTTSNKYQLIGFVGDDGIAYYKNLDGKEEFVDTVGVVRGKLDLDVEKAGVYSEGQTAVKVDGEYIYIDLDGKKLSGSYKYASTFKNGIAAVQNSSNKWILINAEGKQITDNEFDDIVLSNADTCLTGEKLDKIIAKKDGVYSVYKSDLSGKATDFSFEDIDVITKDGIFAVKKDGKWGFADINGKMIIEPQYDEAHSFSNGFASVKKNDEWILINTNNETIVDGDFIYMGYVTDSGTCIVKNKLSEKETEKRDCYDVLVFSYKDLLFSGK